jgi:tRNA(Arg) A34 adenosine deaminase TadA
MLSRGFDHARTAALCATGVGRGKFRLGAVVMRDTHVISAGFNSYKTHTKLARVTEYPCLHAETHAMFRAGLDNIAGYTMYVIRIGRDGAVRLAKPCMTCQHYIHLSELGNVYYSIDQEEYGTL